MRKLSCVAAALIAVVICGCTKDSSPSKTHVVLQLKWVYNAGFAGDLVAKEKGFWTQHGLDVEVRGGGVGISPIKVVTAKDAQFGVATGDQLLLAREESNPIVAVALAYQENPLCWIVRSKSGIATAKDLKTKKIGLSFIDDEPLFNAMMARVGLDAQKDVQIVPVKFDTSPFLRGEVDAFPVYRNTQGVELANELARQRIDVGFVSPAHEGLVSYSNLYFTTEEYEKSHPEIVQAFLAGVVKGWEYAQEHPDEAAEIVAKYDKETKPGIIQQSVRATNKLVKPTAHDQIGRMTTAGWMSTQQILVQSHQLKKLLDVKSVFVEDHAK